MVIASKIAKKLLIPHLIIRSQSRDTLFGECGRLRERIDITRANQKPLLHIARTNHLAVFDIANKLYTLDAILEYKQFVVDITTKLYTLDAILEYSLL